MKKKHYLQLFTYLGLSQKEFAQKYAISQSALSNTLNGRIKSLPVDIVYKLHRQCGISLLWLVAGKGEMLAIESEDTLTVEERELLMIIRKNPNFIQIIKKFLQILDDVI